MIHDVDAALRELIEREVIDGGDIEVDFAAPSRDWAAKRNKPTVNVYLFQIREELDRRLVQPERVAGEGGVVSGRRLPPRFFELSYMITAWTHRVEDDHRLLSAVLLALLPHQRIPVDVLPPTLAEDSPPLHMTVGSGPGGGGSLSSLWTQIGGSLRPALGVRVVVPFEAGMELSAGPPVTEAPRLRVSAGERHSEEVVGGGAEAGTDDAVPERSDGAAVESVTGGSEEEPGRTVRMRELPRDP